MRDVQESAHSFSLLFWKFEIFILPKKKSSNMFSEQNYIVRCIPFFFWGRGHAWCTYSNSFKNTTCYYMKQDSKTWPDSVSLVPLTDLNVKWFKTASKILRRASFVKLLTPRVRLENIYTSNWSIEKIHYCLSGCNAWVNHCKSGRKHAASVPVVG